MAQIAKFELEERVKSSPQVIDKFFEQNSRQCSNHARALGQERILFGNFDLVFKLKIGSKTLKLKIEAINAWERSISFSVIEGVLLKSFKSFKIKATFTDWRVKWSIEYEQVDYDSVRAPDQFTVMVKELTKALEAHLFSTIFK